MHAVFAKLATTGAELLGVRTPASYLHRMVRTTWIDGRRREAVLLHVVEGFSFREIGRQTGVSLFTAASRYRLAVRRLRVALAGRRQAP